MISLTGLLAATSLLAQQPLAPLPTAPPVVVPPVPHMPAEPLSLDSAIKWDAERKEQTVPSGTPTANFTFNLTNVSDQVVIIESVRTSCGCTVASLPEQPWKIVPGTNGQISASMNLAGKTGTTVKTLTVTASGNLTKVLYVQATILPPAAPAAAMTPMDREANQKLAIADRQAVFKGECANCHVVPAKGLFSQALYDKACGICHEAANRATMVANLHAIPQETNAEFWRNWIAHGKPGTLMPAFSLADGGILSDEQITSLVNYLVVAIPSKPGAVPTAAAK